MGLIRLWMLRAHGKPAEAPLSQDAANGAFGNPNVKAVLDLLLQIAAAPANHAICTGVWRRLHNPAQFRKLLLIKQGLAAKARTIFEAFYSLGIVAVNPVPQRLALHPCALGRIGAAGAIQDRGDGQNPPRLVRIGYLACLAP